MSVEGRHIEIRGTVQGVGFRPWVYRLAVAKGISGRVRNDASGVVIDAFAAPRILDGFVEELTKSVPPAARIQEVRWQTIAPEPMRSFIILEDDAAADQRGSIPPDLPTCPQCLEEIRDPASRRYRYPFTSCADCGPRFSISADTPYRRDSTSMARFAMCPSCRSEYDSPLDRRFRAHSNACPQCGPRLRLLDAAGVPVESAGDPLEETATAILDGRIVAIKDIGGFHLACDATSAAAVQRLRERRKHDEKPFAIMVADASAAEEFGELDERDRALLNSVERPIVLVRKKAPAPACDELAPGNSRLGVLLAYSPLHHILLSATNRPLVMISGNLPDQPMARSDEEAVSQLSGVADLFVVHDRDIETRTDDSVARVIAGVPTVFRRSRGYVPRPIKVARPFSRPLLACGAELKNSFCLGLDDSAFLGPHIGHLENAATLRAFEEAIETMRRLLGLEPEIVAHDLNPDYLSTHYANSRTGAIRVGVQHHHAHVASCMAQHRIDETVYGLAFDGTGIGTDGNVWGGEIVIADFQQFERLATFRPMSVPGSHTAVRQVWRLALAVLDDAFDGEPPLHEIPLFRHVPMRAIDVVRRMIQERSNCPPAHGVGRYFDAWGSMMMSVPDSNFDGQVAIAWNEVAEPRELSSYPFEIHRFRVPWEIDLRLAVRIAVSELISGTSMSLISARFHNTLASATAEVLRELSQERGMLPVALSGGCFQNGLLTERILAALLPDFQVYRHSEVPPGDGGLALGQALIADAHVRGLERKKLLTADSSMQS